MSKTKKTSAKQGAKQGANGGGGAIPHPHTENGGNGAKCPVSSPFSETLTYDGNERKQTFSFNIDEIGFAQSLTITSHVLTENGNKGIWFILDATHNEKEISIVLNVRDLQLLRYILTRSIYEAH